MFSQKQTRRQLDFLESNEPPTQQTHRPKVVCPMDPAVYMSPSTKQPSIAKAFSGKMVMQETSWLEQLENSSSMEPLHKIR